MQTHKLALVFDIGTLRIAPVHVRIEQHKPVIAAHMHSNTSYEIHYTFCGHGSVTVNGRTYPVEADTLYITGPKVLHAQISDTSDPVIEYTLYLECQRAAIDARDPLSLFAETTFWMGKDNGRVYPLLKQLVDENNRPGLCTRDMSEALLRQIIVALTRMYHQDAPFRAAAPTRDSAPSRAGIMPVIEEAFLYRYASLSLDGLAALLNLSVRQTQRLLRDNFGKTFTQMLSDARMAAAVQYLDGTDLPVTDVAERVGFSSLEHFSTAFRRFMGVSPLKYRRQRRRGG